MQRQNTRSTAKYIIFGAGDFGRQAAELLGFEKVAFFVDNNKEKQGEDYFSKAIKSLDEAILEKDGKCFVVAVSDIYVDDVCSQLKSSGIDDYELLKELKIRMTKDKLLSRPDYIGIYNKAISWVYDNTIEAQGVINNTAMEGAYPEVTGYYIPSLLRWGHKELAIQYATWLCKIQHEDGAWYDTDGTAPYIFDSAQILKGLIAIRSLLPEVDAHIIKGCDWILSNMTDEGRLVAPIDNAWGDGNTFSELIHTYCISPIVDAGRVFGRVDYIEKAKRIADYYTINCKEEILNFGLLSHFYAYVMEAMLDIGRADLAREAMSRIAVKQKESGAVPAYNNVDWVCSTGLFQLAIVWFRLGEIDKGEKAFEYACKLQNESGGWCGSYLSEENLNETNTYFPTSEISWAVKYFLDALYYKNLAQFEAQAQTFGDIIDRTDGRYSCVQKAIKRVNASTLKILDVGCGKGRYLKNLIKDCPQNQYYAVDLSIAVMEYINLPEIEKKQGSLTDIPYPDNYFDVVYTCEALEHAVDISSAVKELCRVVKPGGQVIVVDKNNEMLGYFEIEEWEQWFDEKELTEMLLVHCSDVNVVKDIAFDNTPANGLFYCWAGKVKR